MFLNWTPDLIQTALSTLTDQQRSAIHLAAHLGDASRPGPVRIKTFGFESCNVYLTALETARAKLKNWFAVWGIHKIDDLDFVEPGCSVGGRIQRAAKKEKEREVRRQFMSPPLNGNPHWTAHRCYRKVKRYFANPLTS
jgi:hypothetical protein